jgi:hypothetical protein
MNRSVDLPGRLVPLLVGLTIAGQAAAGPVVLSDHASARHGISVARLHAARLAHSVPALGTVLNPAPLIHLSGEIATDEAEVAGAKAKVVLERQQMAQASALYRHKILALANYQKAEEDLASNQAALAVARTKHAARLAQTEATWGAAMAATLRKGGDPLPQLAAGKAMLVGLSLQPGTTLAAPPQRAEAEAAGTSFALRLIGPVPGMLGRYPGQSFLYEAAAQSGVPVGTTVSASLPAGPERMGVLVPWSAVAWKDGRALVFRADSGNRFEPLPIKTDAPAAGGYLVSAVLSPGDRIVVRGADLLLGSAQNAPSARRDN